MSQDEKPNKEVSVSSCEKTGRQAAEWPPIDSAVSDWTAGGLTAALRSNLNFHEITVAPRIVLQTGRISADQKSDHIDTSVQMAVAVQRAASLGSQVECIALVDDCHATNTLDYASYLNALSGAGFHTDMMLFESSPLLYELALDVFKYLLKESEYSKRFRVVEQQGAFYAELLGRTGMIELLLKPTCDSVMEGLLFDAALCLYARYRKLLSPLYAANHGCPSFFDIHRGMLDYYLTTDASKRVEKPFHSMPYVQHTIATVLSERILDTPYISAIRSGDYPPMPSTTFVQVLESVHKPTQGKLNQLLEFLGEEPVYNLYYDSSGRIELETTRFVGPQVKRQEKVLTERFPLSLSDWDS